jgi:hypothetical protein
MKSGEVVWAKTDKRRLCIVIAVKGTEGLALYGTGTRRDDFERVEIDHRHRFGKRFGLSKPTYFYARCRVRLTDGTVEKSMGDCPAGLFDELWALLRDEAAAIQLEMAAATEVTADVAVVIDTLE